jgi:hypothetical protein
MMNDRALPSMLFRAVCLVALSSLAPFCMSCTSVKAGMGAHPAASATAQASPGGARLPSFAGPLKAGDEVFAIDPDIIVGFDYETAEIRMTADRPRGPTEPFVAAITHAATGAVERCPADAVLRRLAIALSSVRAIRVLSPPDARTLWTQHGESSATLRIRDTIDADPTEFRVIVTRDPDVLVFRDGNNLFVPSVHLANIEPLSLGCRALSKKPRS